MRTAIGRIGYSLIVFLLFSLISLGCSESILGRGAPATRTAIASRSTSLPPSTVPTPTTVDQLTPAESLTLVQVVERVRPAVVNITTQQISYGDFFRPVPIEAGTGSGVIIDKEGHIITNNHVVEGAERLKITLPDERSFDGRIIGTDPLSDLAVVKINGTDLPTVELGDSAALRIGEPLVAIGNALALSGGPTVTSGVVSALGRSIRPDRGGVLYDLIQTDAAINPGNSGGPLVNMRAQVVGINTAIAAAPGGGIGFAIAINSAKPIVQELIALGKIIYSYMGIDFRAVTPALAARASLPVSRGAIVLRVGQNTPASEAGIRPGDIIVTIDDQEVKDDVTLLKAVRKHKPGETVQVTVVRDGDRRTFKVTLGERPTG
ncbi:MAG: trypsin-like peptidase domain-containing protein [Chloroflexi bacterium]|nr:trypsin-like peptidase domain-containing protein [Chloroflexota bacterium]